MWLIDADKLNFYCNYEGDCSGDKSHCQECSNYVLNYRDIKDQPIAYDIDAVVEQLGDYGNEEMDYYRNTPYKKCIEECVHKAIDIVKAGESNG